MADSEKKSFPQIPATVWWGLRERFKKSIPTAVTESLLAAELSVQATAARAYLAELKKLGLVDDEGKPLDVAKKWRMDETYREASDQLLRAAYPAELIETAPPHEGDRDKAVRWFMQVADLGEGAAGNKAGTYFLIGAAEPPDEAPKVRASTSSDRVKRPAPQMPNSNGEKGRSETPAIRQPATAIPLNVNVQIHISADATNDQIESIFANMKKYLT